MHSKNFLPAATFKVILENAVIPTVDLIVFRDDGGNREFLLGKRKNPPSQGQWFVPGGRQFKGETLEEAATRQLKELGITGKLFPLLGCIDFYGINGMGIRYHSLMHLFLVGIRQGTYPRRLGDHSAMKWFQSINPRWPAAVRQALAKAGFK